MKVAIRRFTVFTSDSLLLKIGPTQHSRDISFSNLFSAACIPLILVRHLSSPLYRVLVEVPHL